jgi:acetyl-CoA synthetase
MLTAAPSYDALYRNFTWTLPEYYNIGVDVCDKWADTEPSRLALIHKTASGCDEYSFGDIKNLSNRLANRLVAEGIQAGDRVAILLPQAPETAISHVAIYKSGAIAVPLFCLFGEEALEYRLKNSGAKALITDRQGADKIKPIRKNLPELQTLLLTDGGEDFYGEGQSTVFEPVRTRAEDPALIIYTSGTTGQPKGALHAHRVLLGHLPGVEMSHNFFPQPGDRIWTPADWAWIGGLLDVLMPAWHHGVAVVAHRFEKFDPEAAFSLIEELGIRNMFLPPTALKMLRAVESPEQRWRLAVRSVASGGESMGEELLAWSRTTFNTIANEFYGQTECNMVISSCSELFPARGGSIGKAVPGHRVAVIDAEGNALPPGEIGDIAADRSHPVVFLGYWNNPEATRKKFIGDWLVMGDKGVMDAEGYIKFIGRDDDVITSAGYRIGPGEIEDCLLGHPAVLMAAVIGVPDELRTERIKAFIVLDADWQAGDTLVKDIQDYVKVRLAAHEYPREIEFVDGLPLTTTGKVIRGELRKQEALK